MCGPGMEEPPHQCLSRLLFMLACTSVLGYLSVNACLPGIVQTESTVR